MEFAADMVRPRRNPFYVVLGAVGFLFTITAMSYCLAVLRSVRPPTGVGMAAAGHPLHALMDRHGAGILAAQLVVLAVATVGAVWMDHVEGERIRRRAEQQRDSAAGPTRGVFRQEATAERRQEADDHAGPADGT
jgi:hypothetical protein